MPISSLLKISPSVSVAIMSDFDERSGIVPCVTPWGRWYQTIEELVVEINVPPGTRGKECQCLIKARSLKVSVRGDTIIEVTLLTLACAHCIRCI